MTTVEIITYGCAMNQADSELLTGLLLEEGIEIGGGGIVIVNTCTVKTPTDRKIIKKLEELEGEDREVIVSGCLPVVQPEIVKRFKRFSFLGTNVQDIVETVRELEGGRRVVNISRERRGEMLSRSRENPIREIIAIAQGCRGDCSYCCVKIARGKLRSASRQEIVSRMETALSQGVKEIWLTAQDSGAYGLDRGESLPRLLEDVGRIEGDFMVRIGMMNPSHVREFLPRLVAAYQSDKFYKFLHLPLQSGNDEVLREMNRKYRGDDFRVIVKRLREEFPKIALATDVIVGFPGESEEQFCDTIRLIEEIRPDVLNISRYWPRPRTAAAKIRGVAGGKIKRRSRRVNDLFQRIGREENEKKWLGWKGAALVSQGVPGNYTARNSSYRPIIIHSNEQLLGKRVEVEITEVTWYDLRGRVI